MVSCILYLVFQQNNSVNANGDTDFTFVFNLANQVLENNITGDLYSKSNKLFDIICTYVPQKLFNFEILICRKIQISYKTITWTCCRHTYIYGSKYLLFRCWNLLQTKWKSKGFYDWNVGFSLLNRIHLEFKVNLVSNFWSYKQIFRVKMYTV